MKSQGSYVCERAGGEAASVGRTWDLDEFSSFVSEGQGPRRLNDGLNTAKLCLNGRHREETTSKPTFFLFFFFFKYIQRERESETWMRENHGRLLLHAPHPGSSPPVS